MTFENAEQSLTTALNGLYENREAASIAGMVLECITGKSKMERWLQKNTTLDAVAIAKYDTYAAALIKGVPVQYALSQAWFAGMCLHVNKHTLIPRPETEELVNWCANWAASHLKTTSPLKILEVGTGSGCIAIALQKKLPNAQITALDISSEAIKVAHANALANNAAITFITLDFLNELGWKNLGNYDIIISNPPYILEAEKKTMSLHVVDHEPHAALFVPDHDALVFYLAIANFSTTHLNNGGAIFVEINQSLGTATKNILQEKNYNTNLRKDLFENDRMILATKN